MSDWDEYRVVADEATMIALWDRVDELDTHALTDYAKSLGVQPPDDRDGWAVVLGYGPDLEESALVWAGPDDPSAE